MTSYNTNPRTHGQDLSHCSNHSYFIHKSVSMRPSFGLVMYIYEINTENVGFSKFLKGEQTDSLLDVPRCALILIFVARF